jgi:iron complex outermembrane receptor protein
MIKVFNKTVLGLAIVAMSPVVSDAAQLEVIVVTATKRPAGLQEVPIALSVMEAKKMAEQGIDSLEDIAVFMPNVHINEAGGGDQIFIRGIGSGVNYGFEQSVGTFIDGIYFGRGQASRSTFLDLERVEVLKGPQSTLFGKNTVAGAINITTARPGDEFEGIIDVTAEPEFGGWSTGLTLSGPISDTFGARLVLKRDESDGFMRNTLLNKDEQQEKNTVGRLVLTWQPSEDLYITFKYEDGESHINGRNSVISIASPFSTGAYSTPLGDPDFNAGLDYNRSEQNIGGIRPEDEMHNSQWDISTLTVDWLIGDSTLKSTTGYVNYSFQNYLDVDYGPLRFLGRGRDEDHQQFTQEFLWSSATGETVEYLAGLYYQNEELQHDRVTDANFAGLNPALAGRNATIYGDLYQESETLSAFTQATVHVSDTFTVIAGIRYSKDDKEFEKNQYTSTLFGTEPNAHLAGLYDAALQFATDHNFGAGGATVCSGVPGAPFTTNCVDTPDFDNKRSESHLTGDITLQWDANDDTMIYAKVGNGYKAGGYDEDNNRGRIDAAEYDDETVLSFELGSKMTFMEGRARLNGAIFQSAFKDVQVSAFDGNAGFVVGNAAESQTTGIEVDGMFAATDELTLSASIAYLDATYKSFTDAACSEALFVAEIAAGGSRATCVQDLSGETLQYAPEFSGNISASYVTPIGDNMQLRMGVDARYSAEFEVANDLDANLTQDSYWKANAYIGLMTKDEKWSVSLLGKNLSDELTTNFGNDVPLAGVGFGNTYFQLVDAPRSYEIRVQYKF